MNIKIENIINHTDKEIKGFFKDFRWLSNFESCNIEFEGLIYPSTENAYQAAKTLREDQRKLFLNISASEAKKLGRKIEMRLDWEDIKISVMREVCLSKFHNNPELKAKLLSTGNKYLEETNYWNDRFWGVCNGTGQNNLGKILMEVRDSLK